MGKKEVGDMSNRDRIARLEEREKVLTGRVMALEEVAPVGPRGQGGLLSGRVWVGSVLQVADEALDRIKELEAERDLLRDEITRFRNDYIPPGSWASYRLDRILAGKEGK